MILVIAGLETATGFLVGDYYQKQALHNRNIAARERKFINQLQIDILYNRPAKQLSPYLKQPEEFRLASSAFQNRLREIAVLLSTHNNSGEPMTLPGLQPLLEDYQIKVEKFEAKLAQTAKEIQPLTLSPSPQETIKAKDLIITLVRGKEFVEFVEFPDQLAEFAQMAQSREQQAESALATAENIRIQISIASLFSSIALAMALGIYISQAISKPLSHVTQIAQRVTTESNFDLQVPVTTKDEIGVLATAFNQMVSWVKKYTDQLQQAHQNLEQKVADRTQQLNQTLSKLQQTQAKVIQSEKMSALGQMVAGIAHEINNPINFIHGNIIHASEYSQDLIELVELYQYYFPERPKPIQEKMEDIEWDFVSQDLPKVLNSMMIGSERIHEIVKSLRNFARIDESGSKEVDIHEGIENTLMILNHRLKEKSDRLGIKITKNYGKIPLLECYPGQLNQVWMNLIANAIDALEESPNPQIKISTEFDNDWVRVYIADNGTGISQETQTRLFDPFFTTKPVGKGTGLGLAISYQIIVDKHGGKISCQSILGQGTEFIIQIPRTTRLNLKQLSLCA